MQNSITTTLQPDWIVSGLQNSSSPHVSLSRSSSSRFFSTTTSNFEKTKIRKKVEPIKIPFPRLTSNPADRMRKDWNRFWPTRELKSSLIVTASSETPLSRCFATTMSTNWQVLYKRKIYQLCFCHIFSFLVQRFLSPPRTSHHHQHRSSPAFANQKPFCITFK